MCVRAERFILKGFGDTSFWPDWWVRHVSYLVEVDSNGGKARTAGRDLKGLFQFLLTWQAVGISPDTQAWDSF